MYAEAGPHNLPHFHAYYGDAAAVFSVRSAERIAGSLPRRQTGLVEEWAAFHQSELADNWQRLQDGEARLAIDPLH